jgi:hypothetical protein
LILVEAKKCRYCQTMLVDAQGRPVIVGAESGGRPAVGAAGAAGMGSGAAPSSSAAADQAGPSLLSCLLANLVFPGLGSWRMGHRWRGFLIGAGLLLSILLYAQSAVPIYQKLLTQTLRGRKAVLTAEQQAELDDIIWHKVAAGLFIYSFVDVWLLYRLPTRRSS